MIKESLDKAIIAGTLSIVPQISRGIYPNEVADLLGGHNQRADAEHLILGISKMFLAGYLIDQVNHIYNRRKNGNMTNEELAKKHSEVEKTIYAIFALHTLFQVVSWELNTQRISRGYVQWDQVATDIGAVAAGYTLVKGYDYLRNKVIAKSTDFVNHR